jgi:type I restriction enzyme S subunit
MPNNWPLVPLGELLTSVSRPETVDPEKTYCILGAHWYAGGLYIKQVTPGAGIQAKSLSLVEEGDFVYNRLFAWKGSFALATKENDGCYVSNEFPCFKVNRERLDGAFLWRYLSRTSTWEEALSLSTGGTPTSRNRLKEHKFLAFRIPLPPLDEQRRIVARIEALAAKIEEARRLRHRSGAERQAIFNSFLRKAFERESKKPGWELKPLGTAACIARGKFAFRPRNDARFYGGNYPFIQIGDISNSDRRIQRYSQSLNEEGLAISRMFPKGTVVIAITGATIGVTGILTFDSCFPDSIVGMVANDHESIPEFIYWALEYVKKEALADATQTTQPNINLKNLERLRIPIPPLPEQRRIVVYLDGLQARVDALKKLQAETAAELDALLPSILDKAFKGDL